MFVNDIFPCGYFPARIFFNPTVVACATYYMYFFVQPAVSPLPLSISFSAFFAACLAFVCMLIESSYFLRLLTASTLTVFIFIAIFNTLTGKVGATERERERKFKRAVHVYALSTHTGAAELKCSFICFHLRLIQRKSSLSHCIMCRYFLR